MPRVASLTFRRDSLHTLARALQAALGEAPVAEAIQAALRRTAYRVKNRTAGNLDRHFTVRRKPFIVKGLRVRQARRGAKLRDVFAEVGTIDQFMADHDADAPQQATRAPKEAKRRWIPLGARPYAEAETPPRVWPSRLLNQGRRPKAFAVINDVDMIGRRKTSKPYPVDWLWIQSEVTRQPIPDDWPFERDAAIEIDNVLLDRMEWELDKLMQKAGWR